MRWVKAAWLACAALASISILPSCSKASAADGAPEGPALFAQTCARCHGLSGKGGPALGPGQPGPRNFTDPVFQAARTDEQLEAVIRGGKGGVMPAFGAVYSDAQITSLVAHVRTFNGK